MNFESTKHLLAGLTPCYPEWKGVYRDHHFMISLHDRAERDDYGATRYGLRAGWYTTLMNGDAYWNEMLFPVPGTIVSTRVFMSPKRWKCGFFYLKQAFTMTQEEMLAAVVQHVRDCIDSRLAYDAAMMKVFEDAWQGPKEVPKEEDNSAQMAAAFVAGATAEIMNDLYPDGF